MSPIRFGILTVSDSCYHGEKADESGPELIRLVTDPNTETGNLFQGQVSCTKIVEDNETSIMNTLIAWSDENAADVILTTGGTGFSERDVTPEATRKIIEKDAPGIATAMLVSSLKVTPMAMLSRSICGIRGKSLIINLPGSPKAARECLSSISAAIPHAVDLITNRKTNIIETHKCVQSKAVTCTSSNKKAHNASVNLENVTERHRESPYPMISVKEAAAIMSTMINVNAVEVIDLVDALGRISAENVYSSCDLPPFRASIKDGYAVLASDGKGKRKVLGGIKAGSMISVSLVSGTCVRVNTGAPIPDDATAVVQVEDTKLIKKSFDGMEEEEIEILTEPKCGQDIRPIGCDLKRNSLVLEADTKIGAVEMGLLAACGCAKITVRKQTSVGIMSTGDELQSPGQSPLLPGRVYDSNRITLLSLLRENGFDATDMGIVLDNKQSMISAIENALKQVDVLITSGSVSMGDRDLLKPILQEYFKATIHFGRVNMKPGKPTTFATCVFNGTTKYLLCLPGNPVSATVTAHLFVLPFLKKLCGDNSQPVVIRARLTCSYDLDPRPEYVRAILKWDAKDTLPSAYSTGHQISSKLFSCKRANALLMLPGRSGDIKKLNEGDTVDAMMLNLTA